MKKWIIRLGIAITAGFTVAMAWIVLMWCAVLLAVLWGLLLLPLVLWTLVTMFVARMQSYMRLTQLRALKVQQEPSTTKPLKECYRSYEAQLIAEGELENKVTKELMK